MRVEIRLRFKRAKLAELATVEQQWTAVKSLKPENTPQNDDMVTARIERLDLTLQPRQDTLQFRRLFRLILTIASLEFLM